MKKTSAKSVKTQQKNPKIRKPSKLVEFQEFIKELESGSICHWVQIAEVLGIDKDTITDWKKIPEAQEARRRGIGNALKGMQEAGVKDWKMYESKLKMLGISPIEKTDLTSDGEKIEPIVIYKPEKKTLEDIQGR